MPQTSRRPSANSRGFTIVEVMIVLAVAGLILLIVLIAVPALQRNARNQHRKTAVDLVASEVEEYKNNTGHYPWTGYDDTGENRVKFSHDMESTTELHDFTIYYGTNYEDHNNIYKDGTEAALSRIEVMPGHVCQRDPSVGPGDYEYPMTFGPLGDYNPRYIAVATILEPDVAYCVDTLE
jgi:prepilin-type N-terminal cleavage/methylation domain-containing protein